MNYVMFSVLLLVLFLRCQYSPQSFELTHFQQELNIKLKHSYTSTFEDFLVFILECLKSVLCINLS